MNLSPAALDTIDRFGDKRIDYSTALRDLIRKGLTHAEARLALGNPPAKAEEHPLVTGARKRLDSITARVPPGLPLHYVMQHHHYLCKACGSTADASMLLACERVGCGSKGYHQVLTERVYDLPVVETHTDYVTARCDKCFDWQPRAAVPTLPPPETKVSLPLKSKEDEAVMKIDLKALGLIP